MINPMIGMPQGAEWLVILAIVVLVFGAAKLPELARSPLSASVEIVDDSQAGGVGEGAQGAGIREPHRIWASAHVRPRSLASNM